MPALIVVGKDKGGAPPPLDPLDAQPGGDGDEGSSRNPSEQCSGCRLFEPDQKFCMRYPEWHEHQDTDWCGEYKQGTPQKLGSAAAQSAEPPIESKPPASPLQAGGRPPLGQ